MFACATRQFGSKTLAIVLSLFCATAAASGPLSERQNPPVSALAALSSAPVIEISGARHSPAGILPMMKNRAFGPLLGYAGQMGPAVLRQAPVSSMTTASIAPAARALSRSADLFGAHRIRFGAIGSGARIAAEIRDAARGDASSLCIEGCATLASHLARDNDEARERLVRVSAAVNRTIRYRSDEGLHGELDHWSMGHETVARGAGDCEDYAILKMALLARLGVPLDTMEIVVVRDTGRRLFHAVLSVALDGESLILDNMTDAVVSDRAKPDYAPLFSITAQANYVFGYPAGQQPRQVASIGNALSVAPGAGF
ncbi:transglutaminase-like cysteine peptidase [Hoeflea olei]|uniref:Transglutaminase n=1 Tax=Hoeflea olei TaxID=1480615 RepID=A0A1C1YSK6_9HYPH|nr:transglutaminase-like cysteine peptidase [Hoeflea olei]OCW56503.1 hypothetical protein AWJ14_16260 [Hoeflea olei]